MCEDFLELLEAEAKEMNLDIKKPVRVTKYPEFDRLRHLLDSTAVNRYAKTTVSNPLGGLWS